jgi:long-chain acyl-CoA synthetase
MVELNQNEILNRNLIDRVAIGDLLRRRSRDSGNKEAIVEFINNKRSSLTYRELNLRVNQLVRGLRSKGLNQGDRLAIMSTNRIDFIVVTFACYKSGIIAVPINFLQSSNDIHYNLEHAKVKAVVYEQQLEQVVMEYKEDCQIPPLAVVIEDSQSLCADCNLTDLIKNFENHEIEDTVIHDRDTAQLLYTSGTTSRPKGVETSHLSLYIASLATPLSVPKGVFTSYLVVLPVFHVAAMIPCLSALQMGGKLVMQPKFDPAPIATLLEEERISSTVLLPMMWKLLLSVPGISERNLSALENGFYGMAPMDRNTLESLREVLRCDMHLVSGQSECIPSSMFYGNSSTEFGEGNYWGTPVLTVDQVIMDEEGNELPQGQKGEICWRSPQAMSGYLDNPEATYEVSKYGWHHSGDLGLIDKEGQLLFIDRKKDMIKSGGENIPSCKVEQVILELPGVMQTAVFGVPHPRWAEAVCAAVQLSDEIDLTEVQVIEHCKEYLGGFQVPKHVVFVKEFPLTASGKIKKTDLRKQYNNLCD